MPLSFHRDSSGHTQPAGRIMYTLNWYEYNPTVLATYLPLMCDSRDLERESFHVSFTEHRRERVFM